MILDDTDGLPLDLPADAEAALRQSGLAWADEAESEKLLLAALRAAPESLAVRIGAYKFYFYRARLTEAIDHAQAILAIAARALGLPEDWRRVTSAHAPFSELLPWPRLWLQALLAHGYCMARLGRLEEAREALAKVVILDSANRFRAASLLAHVERGGLEEDES